MKRLRPAHSPERLAEIYDAPHQSNLWLDHNARIESTIAVGKFLMTYYDPWAPVVVDLSCGDGQIATEVAKTHLGWEGRLHLGDFAPGYPITGPLEQTIKEIPDADLFILSETLEHLDKPLEALASIREHTSMLLMSTPIDEPLDSNNEQHYWSWSVDDIDHMLRAAGFTPAVKSLLYLPTYYDFQIVGAL